MVIQLDRETTEAALLFLKRVKCEDVQLKAEGNVLYWLASSLVHAHVQAGRRDTENFDMLFNLDTLLTLVKRGKGESIMLELTPGEGCKVKIGRNSASFAERALSRRYQPVKPEKVNKLPIAAERVAALGQFHGVKGPQAYFKVTAGRIYATNGIVAAMFDGGAECQETLKPVDGCYINSAILPFLGKGREIFLSPSATYLVDSALRAVVQAPNHEACRMFPERVVTAFQTCGGFEYSFALNAEEVRTLLQSYGKISDEDSIRLESDGKSLTAIIEGNGAEVREELELHEPTRAVFGEVFQATSLLAFLKEAHSKLFVYANEGTHYLIHASDTPFWLVSPRRA